MSAPVKRRVVATVGSAKTATLQMKHAQSTYKRRKRDLLRRVNYRNSFSVVVLPILAIVYWYWYYLSSPYLQPSRTVIKALIIYFNVTLLAFTAGYHKYYAHNTFQTSLKWLQLYFLLFGSSLGMGSARWWAALHRAHHRFTDDTEKDPYLIKRGWLWTHWGWLVKKPKVVTFYQQFIQQEFPTNNEKGQYNSTKDRVHMFDNDNDENKRNTTIQDQFPHHQDDIVNEISSLPGSSDLDLISSAKAQIASSPSDRSPGLLLWQEKWYFVCFIATTFVLPASLAVITHEPVAHCILFIGIFRMICAQQCMLLAESICHKGHILAFPTQPFTDSNSSCNCHNPLAILLTYGQSAQNYHHEFPHDYRASNSWVLFDPTKWFIWTLHAIGIVSDLCRTPEELIAQLKVQHQQVLLNRAKSQLNWGTPIAKLPVLSAKEFKRIIETSKHSDRCYVVIQNIIHDITPFMEQHPGGIQVLKASHGKDATTAFFGGVYNHLTAANNLLATMRIGVLGNPEDLWRRAMKEEPQEDFDSRKLYKTAEAA